MADRELLEKAAKAAGIQLADDIDSSIPSGGLWILGRMGRDEVWNPLGDDGDAFRLMVSLGIEAYNDRYCGCARPTDKRRSYMFESISGNGDCAEAAIRRAIVRAAAAMGDAQ